MSKFSYWLFWIKLNALNFIINNKYRWNLNNKQNIILRQITNKFYEYKDWKYIIKENQNDNIIKYIRNSKQVQVYLLYKLLSEQIKMRKKEQKKDISKDIGILATLWNIWGREKAHKNIDTWWAVLKFLWYKIRFGDLANKINNSLEFKKMIINLKQLNNQK